MNISAKLKVSASKSATSPSCKTLTASLSQKNEKNEEKNTAKVYTAEESLTALLHWMQQNNADRIITKTQIIIAPGYTFRIIRALITNFHQPQSTLLLLISAIVGDDWRSIYDYALTHEYRFLSYGDGSILWVNH